MYLYIWITQLHVHTLAEIFHVKNWAGVILVNHYVAPPTYLPKVLHLVFSVTYYLELRCAITFYYGSHFLPTRVQLVV